MAVLKVLEWPHKVLETKSVDVNDFNEELKQFVSDMHETMDAANGIGLAAIQIGVPKRIIVMDIAKKDEKKNPMYFVNPVIKNKNKDLSTYEEGCLSVPDQFAEVDRPATCEVEYLDYYGEKKILKAEGLLATCIQHEMDHLEGILFIDYLSKLKKTIILKKLSKQKDKIDRIVV